MTRRLGSRRSYLGGPLNVVRPLRLLSGGLTVALVIGVLGTTAAEAKPTKPGGVTGLAATVTPSHGTYGVASTWNAVTGATGYKASIIRAGATVASATVTSPAWNATLTTPPGAVTLSVKAVVGRHPGHASSLTVNLPDVTAPTGSYSSTWDNNTGVATLTQDSLSDDSPVAQVTRTVNWRDGSAPQAWTTGTTLTHTYPLTAARYVPTVTLEDAAHNIAVVDAAAVVINDTTAPTGTFAVTPATAWATLTAVTVSQSALADNWSPQADVTRSVDWGDGSPASAWTTGTTISHVYTTGGSFTPQVTITDEAHNAAQVATSAVAVTVDSVAPVVRLLLPRAHQHSVRAFRTLRGRATDTAGTGVKVVALRIVEKRGTRWYGYRPATRTWVRAATKAKAFARSRTMSRTTNSLHRWSGRIVGLRKGTLIYRVKATDNVGNASRTLTHRATLTKR